jgi:hypothetical protein
MAVVDAGETTTVAAPRRDGMKFAVFLSSLLLALGVEAYVYGWISPDRPPIRSDGWGYYLPLPAVFIHGDVTLSFLNASDLPPEVERYRLKDGDWQGLSPTQNGFRDKYALGPAVMQLPFFLAALGVAKHAGGIVNGFETPFQVASALAGAVYFALGAALTYVTARMRCSRAASLAATAFAVLATNVLLYGSFDASYSHAYGFCLVAALANLTVRRADAKEPPPFSEFAVFGLLIGLAVMVRPTNAVVALLYHVFASKSGFQRFIKGSALAVLMSAVAASPQMIWWFVTTGKPIYYSYRGEGFDLLHPQIIAYLFAIRKGAFFWHPTYLVMIAALVGELRRRPKEGGVVAVIVALNIYLGASWSDITFGGSFGCRQIVEMIPLLVPPTAAAIDRIASGSQHRFAVILLAACLIAVNALQFNGYVIGTLPFNNTTKDAYLAFWSDPLGLRR